MSRTRSAAFALAAAATAGAGAGAGAAVGRAGVGRTAARAAACTPTRTNERSTKAPAVAHSGEASARTPLLLRVEPVLRGPFGCGAFDFIGWIPLFRGVRAWCLGP